MLRYDEQDMSSVESDLGSDIRLIGPQVRQTEFAAGITNSPCREWRLTIGENTNYDVPASITARYESRAALTRDVGLPSEP